jgi:hypothetical protein
VRTRRVHRRRRRWFRPRRRLATATAVVPDVVAEASGLYRVADPSVAGYEVYRGVDGAAIDFDAAPWAASPTLPIAGPLGPDHRYELVARWRNAYGLVTLNVGAAIFDLDAGGAELATPPSDPTEITVAAAAAGTVLVTARYAYDADGDNQADAFLVFLTSSGTDPDPGVDVPAEVAIAKADGVARLAYTSSAFSEGATVKVIVRTRRSGTPDVDSLGDDVYAATATLLGPSAPAAAGAFPGGVAEQVQ